MNKTDKLNKLQKQYMDQDALLRERESVHETWFNESTTDYWRHERMYKTIAPFSTFYQNAKWLTVGDGRYGLDAIRLKKIFQLTDIFPTDIGENMLRVSKENGWINDFGVENAEKLSFADNSFDVSFCKEAFHHFPRPYMALYEMLRVTRRAVVMIEPAERLVLNGVKSKSYILSALKLFFSKITGRNYTPYVPEMLPISHSFEISGNYLYTVSVREMEKLVHGMDLGGIAWRGFNDSYEKGCEFEEAIPGNLLFEKIRKSIDTGDILCSKHPQFHKPNMTTIILFKEKPDTVLIKELIGDGFHVPQMHANPFLVNP